MRFSKKIVLFFLIISSLSLCQKNYQGVDADTIQPQRFDMGKMWTFENPPLKYFKEEYNFSPSEQWLENVRKSALKFGSGCSASFISEDALIMTNHHCVRGIIQKAVKEDENFLRDGFYAENPEDERIIPDLYVDQLLSIEDITDEIQSAIDRGATNEEKINLKEEKIDEIISSTFDREGALLYKVVSLYNGGKYSLYGYKRYFDIRLVFVPDLRTAKLGGDYDNFTYPRHGLDCAFLRAYENGEPAKIKNYFTWSDSGAVEGETVFVVGNPGRTDRINTMAQIEYNRDVRYPALVNLVSKIYDVYFEKVKETSAEDYDLIAKLYSIGNSLKVYKGTLKSLNGHFIIERKKAFEKEFKSRVQSNKSLNNKYGFLWDEIEKTQNKISENSPQISAYALNSAFSSQYFTIAKELVKFAEEYKKGIEERGKAYPQSFIDSIANKIWPEKFDKEIQNKILEAQIDFFYEKLGTENELLKDLIEGKRGKEAVEFILKNSMINSREKVEALVRQSWQEILSTEDPIIQFEIKSREKLKNLRKKNKKLYAGEEVNNQLLGKALYEIYGEALPPDATGTLRIADGVIKKYSYNGTIAPAHTTFYGMLEKHYAFNKEFPFNLPALWNDLPEEFDLSTPLDFISTNDIIGGNSGSPVINKNAEIVGVAFDGNYESLASKYIFTTEANRTISVHSLGMIEAIRDLYKAKTLSDEIVKGKRGN